VVKDQEPAEAKPEAIYVGTNLTAWNLHFRPKVRASAELPQSLSYSVFRILLFRFFDYHLLIFSARGIESRISRGYAHANQCHCISFHSRGKHMTPIRWFLDPDSEPFAKFGITTSSRVERHGYGESPSTTPNRGSLLDDGLWLTPGAWVA
jgi:hypothetical protein